MSLSSSMWAGVTGLLSHGEKMNVIGNNLANVNTVGFKSQRMDFQDFVYQNTYTNSGISQVGRGVKVGAILGDFSQGTFENTQEVTDLAITGRGFFKVKPEGSNQEYYTRAGNFRFDKAGNLKDPNGYTLQGWKVDTSNAAQRAAGGTAPSTNTTKVQGTGMPTDVKLDTWTISPLQTTQVSFSMNLSKDGVDNSRYSGHPFTSLLENWNGVQPPLPNTSPLSSSQYSGTPASITVYDESGGAHTLSVYFDKVTQGDYADSTTSEQMWEYVVTMDPAEDVRQVAEPKNAGWYEAAALKGTGKSYTAKEDFTAVEYIDPLDPTQGTVTRQYNKGDVLSPADIAALADYSSTDNNGGFTIKNITETKMAGVLMTGTLTFDSAGGLKNQSAYVVNGTRAPINIGGSDADAVYSEGNGYAIDVEGDPIPVMNENNPAAYMYPTDVSKNGYPLMVANFTGIPGAHSVGSVPDADKYLIELDFGIKASNLDQPWQSSLPLSVTNTPTAQEAIAKQYGTIAADADPTDPDYAEKHLKYLYSQEGVADVYTSVVKNPKDGALPAYLYENPNYSASKYLAAYKKLYTAYNNQEIAKAMANEKTDYNKDVYTALKTIDTIAESASTAYNAGLAAAKAKEAADAAVDNSVTPPVRNPSLDTKATAAAKRAKEAADQADRAAAKAQQAVQAANDASTAAGNAGNAALAAELAAAANSLADIETQTTALTAELNRIITAGFTTEVDYKGTMDTLETAVETTGAAFTTYDKEHKHKFTSTAEQDAAIAAKEVSDVEILNLQLEIVKNGRYLGADLDNPIANKTQTGTANDPLDPLLWDVDKITTRPWTTDINDADNGSMASYLLEAEPSLASELANYTEPVIRTSGAFTSTSSGGTAENSVISASQNGYGYGDLTSWSVDSDGILSGVYSNGVTLPLYQIALYDFTNKQGLRREGGNLFSQTMASGDPSSAAAGSSGFGTINAQSLEGSNVDMSTEFVYMISTQRGFQSNSKMITTVDTMLDTVINMKR